MTGAASWVMAGAVCLGALGLYLIISSRRGLWPSRSHLVWVGAVSVVTLTVSGLACLVLAYQIGIRAFNVHIFRLPLRPVAALCMGAVVLSLVSDALDNSRDRSAEGEDGAA